MPNTRKMTPENLKECAAVRELLRQEKNRSGMTQSILANMIGRSDKTVSAIVNGRIRVTVPVARKLAKVFGVPLSHILPWTHELASKHDAAELIEEYRALSVENQKVATRLIRSLLDAQEDPE